MRWSAEAPGDEVDGRGGDHRDHGDHTAGHITYWFKQDKLAFVGDTLFSVGCGRIIEGDPEMMWASLLKIRNLPADTEVFCGHEYTAANVNFALTVEPKNLALRTRAQEVVQLVLRAAEFAREDRELVRLRVGADVLFGAVHERPDHDVAALAH